MTLWEDLPAEYAINKRFGLSNIIPKDMPTESKKILRGSVREFVLAAQIAGEKIPSVINETYNCQIIQYIDITVKTIKDTPKTALIFQKSIRPLCVIRLHDSVHEVYSFASKRLSQTESGEIVTESSVITDAFLTELQDGSRERFLNELAFGNIRNRADKLAFYMEMLVKAYLLTNKGLFKGQDDLFTSSVWYDSDKVNVLYGKLYALRSAKDRQNGLSLPSEKAAVNGEIRQVIDEINSII